MIEYEIIEVNVYDDPTLVLNGAGEYGWSVVGLYVNDKTKRVVFVLSRNKAMMP